MNKYLLDMVGGYILFIVCIGVLMFFKRLHALRTGRVPMTHFKTYATEAPEDLKVIQNHFSNQFQAPVLFFVTCLAAVQLNVVTTTTLILGGCFIVTRLVHSIVHLGSNQIRPRALAFGCGLFILVAMWLQILLS